MAVVVFAAAPHGNVPVPPVGLRDGLRQTWTGWDGSVWTLSDPASGVYLAAADVVGLGEAPSQRYASTSSVPGSRYRGRRVLERPVKWLVDVVADNPAAWVALNRAFRRTLDRDRPGLWTITFPAGGTYTLECRYDGAPMSFGVDPLQTCDAEYAIDLVADQHPYWRGDPVTASFGPGTSSNFIPGGGGPPFTISEGSTLAAASITNPGDVDAWPVWTFRDAFTTLTATVGGSTIGVVPDLVANDVLVVDTDPRRQSATLNGTRVRGIISPHDFAPIPAGTTTPITFVWVGTGTASVSIVPEYERLL